MSNSGNQYVTRRDALAILASTPLVGMACETTDAVSPAVIEECTRTSSNPLGPYHRENAPFTAALAEGIPGEVVRFSGRVQTDACRAVEGAIVDIWHCDADGLYDNNLFPEPEIAIDQYRLRGRVTTSATGEYAFETILPGLYGDRPRHIHIQITAPGMVMLTTQIYFADDERIIDYDLATPELVVTLDRDGEVTAGRFDVTLESAA